MLVEMSYTTLTLRTLPFEGDTTVTPGLTEQMGSVKSTSNKPVKPQTRCSPHVVL